MAKGPRKNADDLREAVKLLVRATTGVTDVVQEMHVRIGGGPAILGSPLAVPVRLLTSPTYGSVRGVTKLVGAAIDRVLRELKPFLGESTPGPEREAIVAVLNGVLGDWLAQTKSPFAIEMRLWHEELGPKVVVLVHGSAMNHLQWRRNGHDHGEALARDQGFSVVRVQYNSGLPIAENGRLLAERLEEIAGADEIAIVGHSMGGLVARVACRVGEEEGRAWRSKVRKLVTLGSPHLGSPVERGGSLIDAMLPLSSYSAPLLPLAKIRSAGITDMRHGIDVPLPKGVDCFAIAAERDRVVPVKSAYGPFPKENCSLAPNASHLDLLGDPVAYEAIARALAS